MAAIEIGRPRIEPLLSMSKVTTVSRKSVSRSILYDRELPGDTMTRASRAASSMPSS